MKGDPLYQARRTLHTGDKLLTDRQRSRLEALFAAEEHVEVEATWGIYQRMIAAYREPDKKLGKQMMQAVIDAVSTGVPAALVEIRKLGRTLKQRAADVLAFFDRPGTSDQASSPWFTSRSGCCLAYLAKLLWGGFRLRRNPDDRRAHGCRTPPPASTARYPSRKLGYVNVNPVERRRALEIRLSPAACRPVASP